MNKERLKHLINLLKDHHLDGLALNAGPDLNYFTGLQFHLSERPVIFIATQQNNFAIIYPELENEKIKTLGSVIKSYSYSEDHKTWDNVFSLAFKDLNLIEGSLGVSPTSMRFMELELIKTSTTNLRIVSAASLIKEMRVRKDDQEIKNIRKAISIAEQALIRVLPYINIGKTEKEIANELTLQLLRAGSEPELPFMPIIASGPNSANPHAIPSERSLQKGDLLVIDWGAKINGYVSDITRTFSIGIPSEKFQNIANIVKIANESARKLAKTNLTAAEIDCAAREVIQKAGYAEFFFHRTGHGIGMEPHEEPYIQAGNNLLLRPGMTFTIEPGI
jgi:Xaa-Pro dipeptidase